MQFRRQLFPGGKAAVYSNELHEVDDRLSPIEFFRILCGQIIEDGTHADLITADGRYAELFRLQAKRFEEAPS